MEYPHFFLQEIHLQGAHFPLLLGGGLISRHLPKTHAITAGTQKNRISHHRQNSHHQQQITMGTAHSAYPLTSPNLNKTRPALCKTKGNSIQLSHRQQQITMGTARSTHPLTSPSLNQTMRTLCRTPRKFIPTLTPTTANHTVHGSFNTPATDITKS